MNITPSGAVEVSHIWGQSLQLTSAGDLPVSIDTTGNPQATLERVLRIVMTNPLLTNAINQAIGRPDDLFNPNFGSGIRAAIGESLTSSLLAAITAAITAAISADPYIASNPAPTVSATQVAINTVQLIVSATSITGQTFTLPSLILTPQGVTVGAST